MHLLITEEEEEEEEEVSPQSYKILKDPESMMVFLHCLRCMGIISPTKWSELQATPNGC